MLELDLRSGRHRELLKVFENVDAILYYVDWIIAVVCVLDYCRMKKGSDGSDVGHDEKARLSSL